MIFLGISFSRLKEELEQGMRLTIPQICPHDIADIIVGCWMSNPDDRPSFSRIKYALEKNIESFNTISENENSVVSSLNELQYSTLIFDTKTAKDQYTAIQKSNPYYNKLLSKPLQNKDQGFAKEETTYTTIDVTRTEAYKDARLSNIKKE